MGRRQRKAQRNKKVKPHIWVFCEGKTEENYVKLLRSKYRIPIDIITKQVGNKITDSFIRNHKRGVPQHKKDMNFLMYDADDAGVLERIKSIKTAKLLVSNPSIELWFLLHYKNQKASITGRACIEELSKRNRVKYNKVVIEKRLSEKLNEQTYKACTRAAELKQFKNPSSNIYEFIHALDDLTNESHES